MYQSALAAKSARDAGSLAAELAAAGLAHLRVHDLDFSAVGLVEGDEEMAPPEAGALANRLIRKLLASGGLPPAALAAWITSGKSAAELMQQFPRHFRIEGEEVADRLEADTQVGMIGAFAHRRHRTGVADAPQQ